MTRYLARLPSSSGFRSRLASFRSLASKASSLTIRMPPGSRSREVGDQRGGIHRHQGVQPVAGREDLLRREVDLKTADAGSVPRGARISAGKSGNVATSLPARAEVLVSCVPANCMPSPESPARRTVAERSS